jgi:tRNA(Arg) A34 adenosine deaminase TadA
VGQGQRSAAVTLGLPSWVDGVIGAPGTAFPTVDARMAVVIALARQNVERRSGGPFGAAVFESETGLLVAAGVNRVLQAGASIAHAEVLALTLAQRRVGSFDLSAAGLARHELVTSVEPCAMCLGALVWSGVRRVVTGARDADARDVGFDEGPKPPDWVAALEQRGIDVVRDVRRDDACAVLAAYRASGAPVYNPRRHP